MKKYLFMAVAAIAALSSCSSDDEVFNSEAKKALTFTATMESIGGDTRATYDAANKCAAWEVGDEIVISGIVSLNPFGTPEIESAVYSAQSAGTTTSFIPKTVGDEVSRNDKSYYAYFPASLVDIESGQLELPATITAEYGNFNMPMFGKSFLNTPDLTFKNICGILAITVNNEQLTQVSSVKVSSSNCATSGLFTIDSNNQCQITLNEPSNTATVTYTEPVQTDATGKVFYVAIPPQTYKNLKIELSADGTNFTKTMVTRKDVDILIERSKIYNITFADNSVPATTGTAKATIGGSEVYVNWIQLWKGGPKFAEYNVGATSATEYGGYYCWGGSIDKDPNMACWNGSGVLTGDNDTATKLWGSNWRMPTRAELEDLLKSDNCNVEWKDDYNGTSGLLCTGKDAYAANSVFLPAAGIYNNFQGYSGSYWSSTSNGSIYAYFLDFHSVSQLVSNGDRDNGYSVRAVLSE